MFLSFEKYSRGQLFYFSPRSGGTYPCYGPKIMLTQSRIGDNITPVSASFQWLRFILGFIFHYVILITFKARHGLAPPYISGLLSPYEPGHRLSSSDRAWLAILLSRLITKLDRYFAVRAPWTSAREDQACRVSSFLFYFTS